MDKRIIAVALGGICIVGLILRLIPIEAVFGGSFTSFIETDSYSRMYYAQQIAAMPGWEAVAYTWDNNLYHPSAGNLWRYEAVENSFAVISLWKK